MNELAQLKTFLENQKSYCRQLLSSFKNSTVYCPPSFDGVLCWSQQSFNSTASVPCPPQFVFGYKNPQTTAVATKNCTFRTEWVGNHDFTDYRLCAPPSGHYIAVLPDLEKWLPIIKIVSKTGYSSSLITLMIAMIIFSLLRKLRNARNRLHMHLFVSFIMRAFMTILKDWLFADGLVSNVFDNTPNLSNEKENMWPCKAITSLWQYFIVANYFWIFMEGLYLHNLIFFAFCGDASTIVVYICLGWGVPLIVVAVWIIIRITMEDTLCWTTHDHDLLFLIIQIPIVISILLNFILFINIVRVLLIKMKNSVQLQRRKMQYGRWAKSTLVLVPLFGAPSTILLGLSYHKDYRVHLVWLFCDQLFVSFQGCFVALLYCILNGEVRTEIQRSWRARKSRRTGETLSLTRRSFPKISDSVPHNIVLNITTL